MRTSSVVFLSNIISNGLRQLNSFSFSIKRQLSYFSFGPIWAKKHQNVNNQDSTVRYKIFVFYTFYTFSLMYMYTSVLYVSLRNLNRGRTHPFFVNLDLNVVTGFRVRDDMS